MSKTYHIITYGCDANRADSERIAGLLENCGYKEKKPDLKIALAGCMNHYDKKTLKDRLPYIDVFLPMKELSLLPQKLGIKKELFSQIKPSYQSKFRAYVLISYGCNNFCSYCVVPFARGKERSRPEKDIINEVCWLVNNGYKEIWLLGQNVNSYKDIPLAELLLKINEIPGKFWIRFASPHPKDFSDKLIQAMKKANKFPKYVNLPVQSGNDKILKKMNRPYVISQYKSLVKKIRKAMPEIALSTDVIVGFPGETKKQFQDTAKLFKEMKFDMAFISEYSPRPKTAAAIAFKDNVPNKEKRVRKNILTDILRKTALEKNKKLIGKTIEVLIDKKNNGRIFGKTEGNKNIEIIENKKIKIGEFDKIKIIEANSWHLKGEPI